MKHRAKLNITTLVLFSNWPYVSIFHETRRHMSRIMRKPAFCICEKQRRRSAPWYGNRVADQHLCFLATWIAQSLNLLNPKFQASSHLLWLYSLVCVAPGQKPRRPVFSQRGQEKRTKEKRTKKKNLCFR